MIDLTGQIFNKVKVLRVDFKKSTKSNVYWFCECPCGEIFSTRTYNLRTSVVRCKTCVEKKQREFNESARIDMTGQRFGWLEVLELDTECSKKSKSGAYWKCRCKCGEMISASGVDLRRGNRTSCGCKRRQTLRNTTTHGASKENWYNNWKNMVYRTTNPKSKAFARYEKVVQEGEKIDPEFVTDPWAFFAEIGEKTRPDLSIDRINNSKGYVKGNIRWADAHTQYINRNIVKRSKAEEKILDLARAAASKDELVSLIENQLDPSLLRSVSLP